jgi:two-component system sensor histidine kinase/response regulator
MRRRSYELVLMDMQMPVMDGLVATIEIRKNQRWQNLPVVAMTANATPEDRAACMAAGMVDFISKPINPDLLHDALLRHIRPRRPMSSGVHAMPRQSESGGGLPSHIEGMDMAAGLSRCLGKQPQYLSLLRRFRDGNKDTAQDIRIAFESGDWETAMRLAHTAKGVSANIGATRLEACAASLEQALKNRHSQTVPFALMSFDTTLAGLLTELETKLPPRPEAPPDPVNKDALAAVCRVLMPLLKECETAAVDFFEDGSGQLKAAFPLDYPAIAAAVRSYDFERAHAALDKAMKKANILE